MDKYNSLIKLLQSDKTIKGKADIGTNNECVNVLLSFDSEEFVSWENVNNQVGSKNINEYKKLCEKYNVSFECDEN